MTTDRKTLKRNARETIRGTRPAPMLVALVYLAIVVVLNVLGMSLDGTLAAYRTMFETAMSGGPVQYVAPVARSGLFTQLLNLALKLMGAVVSVGFVLYSMRVWRRLGGSVGNLFDGFGVFIRSVWIQLLPSLLVGLWTMAYLVPVTALMLMTGQTWWTFVGLPLLIPAIRAGYSYSLATYIMLDRQDLNCWQCVMLSKRLMQGHKWELFVLDLSFLGWELLAAVIPLAGLFLLAWVMAYLQVTVAGFYDAVAGIAPAADAPGTDVPPVM